MSNVNSLQLESNSKIKINFDGGDLSSDSGLLLIKEFAHKFGFDKHISQFKTDKNDIRRVHKDRQNLAQLIYQILAGYFNDNDADELTNEPVFKSILGKDALASQPTLSRFWNRMDADTVKQFEDIIRQMRSSAYKIQMPEQVLLDLDSTLLNTYGKQEGEIAEATKDNMIDYVVRYDDFEYKAGKWDYPRRVIVKVEKPYNQLTYQYSFIVTNMDLSPEELIKYYRNRGTMENFIKEGKSGFDFASTPSKDKVVNANHLLLHVLAYNLFNCFKRLVLPESMKKMLIDTIRLKLLKIASKIVKAARYIHFKLCSSCPYKNEFYEILENIRRLPQLE